MSQKFSTASPKQFDKTWDVGVLGLDAGAAVIFNPNITDKTVAFFQHQGFFATAPGFISYSVFPGSRIEILSNNINDGGSLTYMLIERSDL